ncbi:hypothetical protein Q4488_04980 [Amphritea sp. 1_MG-2023]|uniref:hypothetical protein n=1 Tax=Amphritea sp. 1_MG-2023 TaxID=3062670 RepID=UPI0026E34FA9|nr:hypothetical protein [Amphritea sp. 1_MG-2023]MDO6562732.1 hypothetical protein [Amphritea sp. 1_MG-2023]
MPEKNILIALLMTPLLTGVGDRRTAYATVSRLYFIILLDRLVSVTQYNGVRWLNRAINRLKTRLLSPLIRMISYLPEVTLGSAASKSYPLKSHSLKPQLFGFITGRLEQPWLFNTQRITLQQSLLDRTVSVIDR